MNLKIIPTVLGLLVLLGALSPAGAQAATGNGLDRMGQQLEQAFPVLEGVVLTVAGDTLTLDLKQGQPVRAGDILTLIRFGEEIIHPVTQQVVGRQETDLGEIRVTEVRKDYSLARALALSPDHQPRRGDGVRSVFKKMSVLVAPIHTVASGNVDADTLQLAMESRLAASPRFRVPDFDLKLWMLESGLKMKSLTDPHHLGRLKCQVKVDAILVAKVINIQNQTALSYKMIATGNGEVIKTARLLVPDLESLAAPRRQERPAVQTDFQSSKGGLFRFVDKQEFDFEVVDFAVGDLNGVGGCIVHDFAAPVIEVHAGFVEPVTEKVEDVTAHRFAITHHALGVEPVQRTIERQRLRVEDVEARACDALLVDGPAQRVLVHHVAS